MMSFRLSTRTELLQAMGVMPRPARVPSMPPSGASRRSMSPHPQEPSNKRRRTDDVCSLLGARLSELMLPGLYRMPMKT